ncbi:MAG: LysM peptidoglycan-binding domain-containing protein [Pseudomonadota bacterium]
MKKRILLLSALLALALGGCATPDNQAQGPEQQTAQVAKGVRPSKAEIQARVVQELEQFGERDWTQGSLDEEGKPTYDFPITLNKEVEYFIDYYQTKIPKRFGLYLSRSTRYETVMRAILREYGLPEDLIYVALIESGFSCQAYSKAAAVGPWQFIKASGVRFGLKIDYWVDERQDPIKSTHAAAKYLRELYNEFGSWYLAAAAYNAGENKIRRALSRYEASDYWTISHKQRGYLANETKEYVPRVIAAAIIAKEPAKYGFAEVQYEPAMAFEEVTIHPGVSLNNVAKASGLSPSELATLNPELRHGATPPGGAMYTLRVPVGSKQNFNTAYAQMAPAERAFHMRPTVVTAQRGDTLSAIARTHNIPLNQLALLNPKVSSKRGLRAGQKIFLPGSTRDQDRHHAVRLARGVKTEAAPAAAVAAPLEAHRNAHKIVHVVVKGDTIWHIAQTYNLDHKDIIRWNGAKGQKLAIGDQLVLYVPQVKVEARVDSKLVAKAAAAESKTEARALVYKVQKGDTLSAIAKRFKVSTGSLRRWNNLSDDSLSIGDKLTVRTGRDS